MGFNIFKYEKAKVTLWEHHFRAFNREMVNISGLNLVNEASNATEVEMESCSESMAPGAWSSASPSLTIDKFKNDGHPKVNDFSLKGCQDPCHFLLTINVGKKWSRHRTTLKSNF